MKKTIEVGEKQIALESNAFTPLAYKKQFNKDFQNVDHHDIQFLT